MEVGGKAPFIVCEVADLGRAIDGVLVCKYRCTGQTCVWCELSTLGTCLQTNAISETRIGGVKESDLSREKSLHGRAEHMVMKRLNQHDSIRVTYLK